MKTETIKISRISIVFVIVAIVYGIVMIGSLSSISFFFAERNAARSLLRLALYHKIAEIQVLQDVCLEEIPKIGAHLIRIKHAQEEVVDATTEPETETGSARR